jgi:guanine deaminase
MDHQELMRRAIALSQEAVHSGSGGPFGAVVARDGENIAEGSNSVTSTCDPTAHAEIVAIRGACEALGQFSLEGCEIYCSCEPCPMCLSAIYWARLDRIYFANSRADAHSIGFDDAHLYRELCREPGDREVPAERLLADEGKAAFQAWHDKPDKLTY